MVLLHVPVGHVHWADYNVPYVGMPGICKWGVSTWPMLGEWWMLMRSGLETKGNAPLREQVLRGSCWWTLAWVVQICWP